MILMGNGSEVPDGYVKSPGTLISYLVRTCEHKGKETFDCRERNNNTLSQVVRELPLPFRQASRTDHRSAHRSQNSLNNRFLFNKARLGGRILSQGVLRLI